MVIKGLVTSYLFFCTSIFMTVLTIALVLRIHALVFGIVGPSHYSGERRTREEVNVNTDELPKSGKS